MSRARLLLPASACAALAFCVCRDAHALGPVGVEVGAIAGAGTVPSNTPSGSPSILGFGLGGRGGVVLSGFYGGVEGLYYFGSSENGYSGHSEMYGVDLGYGFKLPFITIRPLVGIGNFTQHVSGSSTIESLSPGTPGQTVSVEDNRSTLYVQPGITALVSLGTLYVGADANVLLLTSLTESDGGSGLGAAVTIHGQVGLRF